MFMAWLVGAYKKGDAFAASVKTKTVTSMCKDTNPLK